MEMVKWQRQFAVFCSVRGNKNDIKMAAWHREAPLETIQIEDLRMENFLKLKTYDWRGFVAVYFSLFFLISRARKRDDKMPFIKAKVVVNTV